MDKIKKIVGFAFREITEKGFFDIKKGNEPIPAVWNESMSIIPENMTKYVNECGYGCCFVFSAYMLNILEKYNINCYMIASKEGNGIRASVLYEDNGELFIANPVEDIEYFTENKIMPENRKDYYDGDSATMIVDGVAHNDSCFTLEEFTKKYGQVWVIGKMSKDTQETLSNAMMTKEEKCILPPEQANYDIKNLLKVQ